MSPALQGRPLTLDHQGVPNIAHCQLPPALNSDPQFLCLFSAPPHAQLLCLLRPILAVTVTVFYSLKTHDRSSLSRCLLTPAGLLHLSKVRVACMLLYYSSLLNNAVTTRSEENEAVYSPRCPTITVGRTGNRYTITSTLEPHFLRWKTEIKLLTSVLL